MASATADCVWRKLETRRGFSPRKGHTAVAHGGALYVFGGTDRKRRALKSTLFSLRAADMPRASWRPVVALGTPPARRSGALGAVHGSRMYVFGGYDGRDGNYFNDLFAFDFETRTWSQLEQRGQVPEPRTDHAMALLCDGARRGRLYVFGGFDGRTRFNNLYAADTCGGDALAGVHWELCEASGAVPCRRFGHSLVAHAGAGGLVVFAGWNGRDTMNDVHVCDLAGGGQRWRKQPTRGAPPPHRYRHTTAVVGDGMFVFGGVDNLQNRYADLQRLDLRAWCWSEVRCTGHVPSSRTFHRTALLGSTMYILGGYDGRERLDDLYGVDVGPKAPAPLLELCAAAVRQAPAVRAGAARLLPAHIVDGVVWRRDAEGALRGGCSMNGCTLFEPGCTAKADPALCLCGRAAFDHASVDEDLLFDRGGGGGRARRRQGRRQRQRGCNDDDECKVCDGERAVRGEPLLERALQALRRAFSAGHETNS
jgi:hypothetical protein